MLPSGIIRGKKCIIGNGVVLDPWALIDEINNLKSQGINIDETNLKKFKVMIVEFHHFEQILTKIGYKVIKSTLDKILKYFDVAHIHPNNCCGSFKVKKTIILLNSKEKFKGSTYELI